MANEVELKLTLPVASATRVHRLPWLRNLSQGPERREHLDSVYFDTPKLTLFDHGFTFRVRRSGKRYLQTVKAVDKSGNGAFGRGEWEHEINRDRPVLKFVKDTPLEGLITKKLRRKLRPVFKTLVTRTRVPLKSDGAELDLAVDRGRIRRYGRAGTEPISEIELELKQGSRLGLSRIAERLARSVSVAYELLSKAEPGYALSRHRQHKPVRARSVRLATGLSVAEAFTIIGLSCLDHALSNERAVRAGDPEGVHQMRVGLRRLRAALSIFKELLHGPKPLAVKRDLKWLSEQLGPAREVDVLRQKRVNPLRNHTPVTAGARVLGRALGAEREAGLARARAALESERYRALGVRTALWLADGGWSRSRNAHVAACRARSVKAFAADVLGRRCKKVLKKARRVDELSAHRRHKLRIASKNLRYGAEFFGSLFSSRKRKTRHRRFGRTLKALQGALGVLNDIEIHKSFAKRIAGRRRRSSAQSRRALAMGYIEGQEQKQSASCITGIEEATKRLADLKKFWK